MYYRDLREYLDILEARGKLIRVKKEINKDTELMPLVRWQFRGLPEEERRAFLFENVTDAKGRKYDIPVAVATHGGSREIYALAMNCKVEEIYEKWGQALANPIEPVLVDKAPVHEVVHQGAELEREGGGLDLLPIPNSTPGFDPAPFITSGNWVTRDVETGIQNVGNYRGHIKGRTRTGVGLNFHNHIGIHWRKAKEKGIPLEAAIVLGAVPAVGLVAVSNIPYGVDEFSVAGGIAGEAIPMVKCKTVDIEVPATAEIVIEGRIPTDYIEPEAPFGEFTGYQGSRRIRPCFEISCITHRKNPIYHAFISQMPPSESSKIRQLGFEGVLFKFLKHDCNIGGIQDVVFHESGGSRSVVVIRLKKNTRSAARQALHCTAGFDPVNCKIIIAVDDDIDPRDMESVNWAMSFRMQPHLDISIAEGKLATLDQSASPPGMSQEDTDFPPPRGASAVMIDATRKWDYTPVALPKKEFMDRARQIWEELELPRLTPRAPYYGYSLGYWSDENIEEAELAVKGEYYQTGEKLAQRREKV